jgi:hypothetical protein
MSIGFAWYTSEVYHALFEVYRCTRIIAFQHESVHLRQYGVSVPFDWTVLE